MATNNSVALIVTSNDRMGDSGKETGYWLEELAVPYFALVDDGQRVVIASPLGGTPPVDPRSVERARQAADTDGGSWFRRWESDEEARKAIASSVATADLQAGQFDAAFVAGGHGAMWDLPHDHALTSFINDLINGNKLVGTVCHGAAVLCGVVDGAGAPTIRNRKITCYSDEEERGLGLEGVVPFMLESRLREMGADVAIGPPRASFTMEDGRLITGQNPASSGPTATLFVTALRDGH